MILPHHLGRIRHSSRPNRESLSKKLGELAEQIKARDGYTCVYCGSTEAPLHLDHVVTRGMGGATVATNIVTSCRRCNCSRKMMSVERWAKYAREKFGIVFDPARVRRQARRKLPELKESC